MAARHQKLAAGQTRSCPHCRATILESAAVCPACKHHLRFGAAQDASDAAPAELALHIAGKLNIDPTAGQREYSVVITITDDQGQEISRKVVGVGGLGPGESRGVELRVEVTPRSGA